MADSTEGPPAPPAPPAPERKKAPGSVSEI